MPFWPFKKRRRTGVSKEAISQPFLDTSTEKQAPPDAPTPAAAEPAPVQRTTSPIPIPQRSSRRPRPESVEADDLELPPSSIGKENVPPLTGSKDDITALPMSYKLEHSPHLRPVDNLERPHIPYNFRNYSGSQVSVQRETASPSPRPNVLRKKRSSYESGTPQRRRSYRSKREEQVREEEIRSMSAQTSIPKRMGEGPLRRDSKKVRSGLKESTISLPPAEESMEGMPEIIEQRGWEIGMFDMLNPRPAVRLSGIRQYVPSSSVRSASPLMTPEPPKREKGKAVSARDTPRKRDTIGNQADVLDASDLRLVLERDAKRREKRRKEQADKLDRKLRSREGKDAEERQSRREERESRRREEDDRKRREARQLAEEQLRAHERAQPPTAVHPAFRDDPMEIVGLGIGAGAAVAAGVVTLGSMRGNDTPPTNEQPEPVDQSENPFSDPAGERDIRPSLEPDIRPSIEVMSGTITPQSQMDEPVVQTAKEVRLSSAATPPISPVPTTPNPRVSSRLSQVQIPQPESEVPAPVPIKDPRRASQTSQPTSERRVGGLASLFRRGGTGRKGSEPSPSEMSFSNTSRESMRNQPLPAHLVDTQPWTAAARRASGTPVRTQSRFREDLPENPISPPDSRVASPVTGTPVGSLPIDVPRQGGTPTAARYDTPISPLIEPGTSLASVDSEGAWLAGSGKRFSKSSVVQRRPEFSTSYEELGTDNDPQHFTLGSSAPDAPEKSPLRNIGTTSGLRASQALSPEDPLDMVEDTAEPPTPTTTGNVQRRATLVQRDPRVRSREGLLDDYAAAEVEPRSATDGRGSFEFDSDDEEPEAELQRASSVQVRRHDSSTAGGNAKMLDIATKRASGTILGDSSQPNTPRL